MTRFIRDTIRVRAMIKNCKKYKRRALLICLTLQVGLAGALLIRAWSKLDANHVSAERRAKLARTLPQEAGTWAPHPASWNDLPADRPITAPQLATSIQAAGDFLVGQCTDSGKFVYRLNLDARISLTSKYNLLRHAGTMYSLAQYYQWQPNEETLAALLRSAEFLQQNIGPLDHSPELLAAWSRPELTGGRHPLKAKLGGAGLSLVALTSLEHIRAGTTPMETLRGLGRFILFMQKLDGSFFSTYVPADGGRRDNWVSLYYPGEAALGLIMLHDLDPNPKWLHAAAKCIAHLAKIRQGKLTVEADHWALLATARILPHLEQCNSLLSRRQALAHAEQICLHILSEQQLTEFSGQAYGGFAYDGRTCPTATRLEGLLAMLDDFDPENSPSATRMDGAVSKGVSFLLRAQVHAGPYTGAMPRGISHLPKRHSAYDRHFNQRVTEVRIDYVQHFLSAMIAYHARFPVEDSGSFPESAHYHIEGSSRLRR